ncbi:MAG: 16S rRNA (cytosine(1402)-N(4))-methyltransferase RsmH [Rhodobacteraceae bacterium]|nr:16S rRNA (cytosine(1402)-N(4))-methyltransferase RsmH [Paracoccaceae bacterium]
MALLASAGPQAGAPPPPSPHRPVLLTPLLARIAPVGGLWLDGTFGAGGYARALLAAGAARVIAVDRDPAALALADPWAGAWGDRLVRVRGNFRDLDRLAPAPLDGVVLDLGVSSMQLDTAGRGFSFLHDGPLDMRMSGEGTSAADLVNNAPEGRLADILRQFGEERAARRIARAILRARAEAPILTTGRLSAIVSACLPAPRAGAIHPATRTFQALRIAVNGELADLARGLAAAERALAPGGWLAVVSFHSLEDRIVKRFLAGAAGTAGRGSRHAPAAAAPAPAAATFRPVVPGGIVADAAERAANPRARSARLRLARRTAAPARPAAAPAATLGLPPLAATEGE